MLLHPFILGFTSMQYLFFLRSFLMGNFPVKIVLLYFFYGVGGRKGMMLCLTMFAAFLCSNVVNN